MSFSLVCLSAACAASLVLPAAQRGQPAAPDPPRLSLPHGPVKRLPSPGGAKVLYGVPSQSGTGGAPELWIVDERTGRRTRLLTIPGTLTAEWSRDGTAFWVNDRRASDLALSYIYNSRTLERLEIDDRIRAADRRIGRFANAHRYFEVERWVDPRAVLVRFHGHTDDPPVVCFDLRYRVDLRGSVRKLSERVEPVSASGCR